MGAAVGLGYWGHAIALSVINFLIIVRLSRVKKKMSDGD